MNFWDIYENLCFKFGKKPNPVGKELGISSGTISQWKSGSIPSGEKLIQIAEYFNVSVDYLLGREDNYMESYNNTDSHLDEMSATLLDDFTLGRWWGNDPIQKAQAEIDIMGEQDSASALFAECKWRNENVDLDVLETLIRRSKLFRYTKVHYYLFSKSGFTKGCMEKAEEMGNVTLVSYVDILNSMK